MKVTLTPDEFFTALKESNRQAINNARDNAPEWVPEPIIGSTCFSRLRIL